MKVNEETVKVQLVEITARIPHPLYQGMKLINETFKTGWDELVTHAIEGEIETMIGDNLASETYPLRIEIKEKLEKYLKEY